MSAFEAVVSANLADKNDNRTTVAMKPKEFLEVGQTIGRHEAFLWVLCYGVSPVAAGWIGGGLFPSAPVLSNAIGFVVGLFAGGFFMNTIISDKKRAANYMLETGKRPVGGVPGLLDAIPESERPARLAATTRAQNAAAAPTSSQPS